MHADDRPPLTYSKLGCRAVGQVNVLLFRSRMSLEGKVETADRRYVIPNGEIGVSCSTVSAKPSFFGTIQMVSNWRRPGSRGGEIAKSEVGRGVGCNMCLIFKPYNKAAIRKTVKTALECRGR